MTTAPETARPPNAPVGVRAPRLPSLMHSTHCWPTGAERRHSGQAARPQRTQER